jgi:hypothetical protein
MDVTELKADLKTRGNPWDKIRTHIRNEIPNETKPTSKWGVSAIDCISEFKGMYSSFVKEYEEIGKHHVTKAKLEEELGHDSIVVAEKGLDASLYIKDLYLFTQPNHNKRIDTTGDTESKFWELIFKECINTTGTKVQQLKVKLGTLSQIDPDFKDVLRFYLGEVNNQNRYTQEQYQHRDRAREFVVKYAVS